MIRSKKDWENRVAIPAHIMRGLMATVDHMLTFDSQPDLASIMIGSIVLGVDNQVGLVQWFTDNPDAYANGTAYGFIMWEVN